MVLSAAAYLSLSQGVIITIMKMLRAARRIRVLYHRRRYRERERERQGGVYKSAIIGTGHIKDASIINNLCLFVRAAEPLISRALQGAALA